MNYWPGTKIPMSTGNAFTSWKEGPSVVLSSHDWKRAETTRQQIAKNPTRSFTIYSKAKALK
jgi:hypothetical protein